ncbi:MAG: hypothetical protein F4234_13880 [Gammaproteobacteria bacterium]|nr:hypothetical protein [Gammaproteobacteria bacterium]MXW26041.1 hypothetical protein [Dehalococcoidia bacterium]MYE29890.1 hypothetical protein [Gammaproteobacteria bacterium]MYF01229.1 hypothetical protein [Gammaproteobacteria bacterium]
MAIHPPEQGFIFWPVGTGDSTTIRLDKTVYLQVDLNHMAKSEDEDDPAWPVIDELIDILPTLQDTPYLSVFALTHPDQDHCRGFEELNKRVIISELWMSPRTFREFRENDDLCDDAEAFHKEAMRRVKATIDAGGDPGRGHRIRIIGYDDLLQDSKFYGFPKKFLTIPGQIITTVDGRDHSGSFKAFVHAPFKEDSFGDRNDCSLAFQISLYNGDNTSKALLMGDLSYPVIRRIFDRSETATLEWNLLLAPHHCSKSVMYWKDEGEDEETLRGDIVRDIGNVALNLGYVVSSSEPVPTTNKPGDNPPHAKAKAQYELIVPNEFICTQEHPNEENPEPIIFEVSAEGLAYLGNIESSKSMSDTLKAAGGGAVKPATAVGFGSGAK